MLKPFDIFLSAKSDDSTWVEQLRRDLEERGVRVWLDKNELRPGDIFPKALENGIDRSRSVGLVVTPASLASMWVTVEYERALALAASDALQLIPILLRDAELPDSLAERQCVDFRNASDYDAHVDRLIWPGITGQRILPYAAEGGAWHVWKRLQDVMFSMAIGYSGFSGLGRVEEMISSIKFGHLDHPLMDPSLRVAVMIDPFGYWPDDRSERSEEQIEIGWVNRAVERIFEIREQTKGTPHELVFILVQHSKAWKLIHPMLDQHVSDRSHYFAIHADLADDDLKRQIRAVWNHVQSDFLRAARLRSVA